jgi:DNA polymerase III sliding clamp (beta) subunit (PCNA family)
VTVTELVLPAEYALRAIRAALVAASKDYARPILTAVLVTVAEGKAEIVATDSYRLVTIQFAAPDSPDGSILVSRDMLATLAKAYSKSAVAKLHEGTMLIIRASDSGVTRAEVTITHPTGTIVDHNGKVDGTFPDYRQLIPVGDASGVPMIAFNPAYLGDIAKIGTEVGTDNTTPVRVETWGACKPATFTILTEGGGDRGMTTKCLLMPVRVEDTVSAADRVAALTKVARAAWDVATIAGPSSVYAAYSAAVDAADAALAAAAVDAAEVNEEATD